MVSGEGQSPGLRGRREYEASPSDPQRSHAQEKGRCGNEKEQKSSVTLGKRNLDIKSRKECQYLFPHLFYEAGVHWSSSVGIQPATVLGQLPVSGAVAGQVLRQHLGKFSAFAWI